MAKTIVNVERPLESGLRNCWYPLAPAADLGSAPLSVKALGEELVLWRDAQGRPHVMADRCPHRDTKLSLGDVVDGALTCVYHGFQFDTTGQCISIPSEGGDCPLARRLRLRSYPAQDRVGLVWGYIGDVELFPPPPLRVAEELESPEWSGFICQATWRTNWLRVYDNLADPMHGSYLHQRSYTLSRGARSGRMRVMELPDDGFLVEREGQRGVNFDWIEFHNTGALWCRLDIPYPQTAGPGDPLRIVGFVTPLDERSCTVYFLRYRQLKGWKRTLWRTLYKSYLERNHWHVLEQDRIALEAQRGIESRVHEHLVQADIGVIRLRRFFQQELARQRAVYARASESNGHAPPAEAETPSVAEAAAVAG
jgi:phenylpropionate dioxygenase-like ring-hydroxylating dioxygenase large terminal subunit